MRLMKKILCLLSLALAVALAGVAWGADLIHYYEYYNLVDSPEEFANVGTEEAPNSGFYYQLRDVSEKRYDGHTLARAQWFATTYENYLWHQDPDTRTIEGHPIYRRTLGGETANVPVATLADLLRSFDYVYINEPQPYTQWLEAHSYPIIPDNYYDTYMNPLESLCVVLPEGRGTLNVKLKNHYARHFPYWYSVDANGDTIVSNPVTPDTSSRDIMEDVRMTVEGYRTYVTPTYAQRVLPEEFMSADISIQPNSTSDYGSTVGYLYFRQSGVMSPDSSGWREAENVPVVIANVYNGDASETTPLRFDMTIFNSTNTTAGDDVVNRIKFHWGASDPLTQELGRFFLMQPYNNAASTPTYGLETRVTNNTGTRYRLYRYSGGSLGINNTYQNIRPNYWAYNLTPDRYGSLPSRFLLDSHSQIAPGLVTVYRGSVTSQDTASGYNTIDMNYGTSASFRLSTFTNNTPQDLTLKYKRVAGMVAGTWDSVLSGRTRVRPFTLNRNTSSGRSPFVDNPDGNKSTEAELKTMTGLPPVLVQAENFPDLGLTAPYFGTDALNAVEIFAAVPEGLVSMDTVASQDAEGNAISVDIPAETALLPLVVRFRLPRVEQLTEAQWQALDEAEDVLTEFRKYGTIWVRSENTKYKDANLLSAISNRLSEGNVSGRQSDIVRAFTYSDPRYNTQKERDALYLEFLVYLADAKSPKGDYTGFIDLIEDDNIPYLVIGDGATDGIWGLSFYISMDGPNPKDDDDEENTAKTKDSGGGGGGCDAGALGVLAMILAGGAFLLRRRMC